MFSFIAACRGGSYEINLLKKTLSKFFFNSKFLNLAVKSSKIEEQHCQRPIPAVFCLPALIKAATLARIIPLEAGPQQSRKRGPVWVFL